MVTRRDVDDLREETAEQDEECGLAGCHGAAVASAKFLRPSIDGGSREEQTVRLCEAHYELIGGSQVRHYSIGHDV